MTQTRTRLFFSFVLFTAHHIERFVRQPGLSTLDFLIALASSAEANPVLPGVAIARGGGKGNGRTKSSDWGTCSFEKSYLGRLFSLPRAQRIALEPFG